MSIKPIQSNPVVPSGKCALANITLVNIAAIILGKALFILLVGFLNISELK